MNTTENLMASAVGQYLSENLSQAPKPTQSKIKKTKKVKQELVAANDQEDADDPSAKPYPNGRKRASKACYECQRRHTRCGFGRPCERCIRLGLQCVDVQSVKKRGRAQKKTEFMETTTSGEQGVTTVSSASPSTCSPPTGNHFCHTPNHFLHQQEIQYHQLPHEVSCNKLDVTQDEAELLDCSEDYENRMFSTILNDPILPPPPAADKLDQSKPQQQPQQPQMNQQAKSALEQLLSALLFNNNPTITSTLSMPQQQPAPVPSLVTSILDIINQKHVQPQPQQVSPVPAPTSQPLPQTPLFETPSPSSPAETVDTTPNNLLTVIETQMVDSIFRKNGVDPDTMLGTVSDLHLFFPRPYEFIKNIETCVNSNLFANDNMGVIISTDIPNVNFVSNSIVSKLGYQSSKDLKSYYDVFLPVQMNSIVQDIKEDRERRMSILASATTGGEILRTKYSITEHKTRSLVMDKSGSIMEFVHKYYRVYNINNPCKLECVYSFLYWM